MLIFGFGLTAQALTPGLIAQGWRVSGTSRSADKAPIIEAVGARPLVFDGQTPVSETYLGQADALLISVPPGVQADPVLLAHPHLRDHRFDWIGYLSTTGVYGDHGGDWVDEATLLTPTSNRGMRRVRAEQAWMALGRETGTPVQCFRLAGIYGPGRNALVSVKGGTARRIIKPGQMFSRIHVADIAQTLMASLAKPNPGQAYNVCDDLPCPPQDVLVHAARLLRVDPPPAIAFEEADLSPMARSFYGENKRVRNDRIKTELGVRLRYPSYREGLVALLQDMAQT